MNPDNFLDLWDIFVNELVGDVWLFIFIGVALIAYISMKGKFPIEVTIMLEMLFLIIVFIKGSLSIIWIFVILGASALFFYIYQKMVR